MNKLGTTNIDSIRIDKRAREELGDIEDLGTSIKQRGQIQPIAVAELTDDPNYKYVLLAGERRLRAIRWAGIEDVLIRIYPSELSPLELKQIELAENYHRKDFTALEKIKLQRDIYDTECAIQGVKISTSPDASGHSMSKQAEMLGVSHATVSMDLKLSRAMEDFPEAGWEKCKNQHEMVKLHKRIEEGLIRKELSKRFQQGTPKNTMLEKFQNSYMIGDCVQGMQKFDSEIFDFIEIDPPYAIGLQQIKMQGGPSNHGVVTGLSEYNEVEPGDYENLMRGVFKEAYRVAKKNSWLICWFGQEPWFEQVFTWLTSAGFNATRMTGVWTKKQAQCNNPSKRLANATEHFFYAWKGDPVLARPGTLNVFTHNPVNAQQKLHPTERPVDMMIDILTLFAFEGASVLVPFAGSGATLLAAALCKMSAVGFDLDKSFKDGYVLKLNKIFGGACSGE